MTVQILRLACFLPPTSYFLPLTPYLLPPFFPTGRG